MTLKQAFFILRHGSAEGNHKYLEAVKVIEDEYNRQKETIEQLQTALFKCGEEMVSTRAEAVKEFAERLKSKQRRILDYDEAGFSAPTNIVYVEAIDNLVKEFTEGETR